MLGKLLVGSGCLLCSLWTLPAAAESSSSEPAVAKAAPEQQNSTAIVGFQSANGISRLQSDARPEGSANGWLTLCFAPCTRRVPVDARFRAVGQQAEPSEPFRLPEGRNRFLVTTAIKEPPRTVPKVLIAVGVTSFLVGPLVVVGGLMKGMSGQDDYEGWMATGAGMILGGAIVAGIGTIWLVVTSSDRQTVVSVARSRVPRLALPGGIGLESRGFTF